MVTSNGSENSRLQVDERARVITVRPGHSRASTIRAFYDAMDQFYSGGSDGELQTESNPVDSDSNVRSDIGIGSSPNAGETDVEPPRDADDRGARDAPTIVGGGRPNEGTPIDPDHTPIEASGADVVETSAERIEQESGESESEQSYPGFHFAPSLHSRGNQLY